MNTITLILGALTLRAETFKALRERSDVFQRGFKALLVVGLVVGAFAAGTLLLVRAVRPANEAQITQQALSGFENSYSGPPEMRPMIESYIREGVAIAFEIEGLPPRAGAAARPIAGVFNWLGATLATPFTWGFAGFLLLGGLLVQWTSGWLGGRAGIAQMLGLAALAFAPQLLGVVTSLLALTRELGGIPALGLLEGALGWIIFLWSAAIYVRATSVAQQFSLARALGAIALAAVVVVVAGIFLAILLGFFFGSTIAFIVSQTQ